MFERYMKSEANGFYSHNNVSSYKTVILSELMTPKLIVVLHLLRISRIWLHATFRIYSTVTLALKEAPFHVSLTREKASTEAMEVIARNNLER